MNRSRFTRAGDSDLRKEKGDLKDCNAWFDHAPRWDQAELRFFPVHVDPNEDPRYLNDALSPVAAQADHHLPTSTCRINAGPKEKQ